MHYGSGRRRRHGADADHPDRLRADLREDTDLFGAATFADLVFDAPGTYRLTARRVVDDTGGLPLIPAVSRAFVVSAAPLTASPTLSPTATPLATTPTARPTGGIPCAGDCNGDGVVTINELSKLVNVALGAVPVSDCAGGDVNRDGVITIDELILAVNTVQVSCAG